MIGAFSDIFGRFSAVALTRVCRVIFGVSLLIASNYSQTRGSKMAYYLFHQLHQCFTLFTPSAPGMIFLVFAGYAVQGLSDPDMCIAIFWAMIADVFPPENRTALFGIVSAGSWASCCLYPTPLSATNFCTVFAAPVVVGPLISSFIAKHYGVDATFEAALWLLSINCVYVVQSLCLSQK